MKLIFKGFIISFLFAALIIAVSCGKKMADQEFQQSNDSKIIAGTPLSYSSNGTVLIKYPESIGSRKNVYCTGVLLNRHWVITASHCVTPNVTMYIEYNGCKYNVINYLINPKLFTYQDQWGASHYSTMDVALLELPQASSVSSCRIPYIKNQIYSGTDNSLVGKQVYCEGYGYQKYDQYGNYDSSSIGKLSYSFNPITFTSNDLGYSHLFVDMNAKYQMIANGDSGSTCFYNEMRNYKITGITSYSTINVSTGNSLPGSYLTAPSVFRDWVNKILSPKISISSTKTGVSIIHNSTYKMSSVPINTIINETFRISNKGTGPLFLGESSYSSPLVEIFDYSSPGCAVICPSWSNEFTVTQPYSYKIPENSYQDFTVQFKASAAGSYTIMLQLYTTDPNYGTFYFFIQGTAQ